MMNTATMEGRKERGREEKSAEAMLALWDGCAHPSWGPGEIPPQLLCIQQVCQAFLPTFPGVQEAGGEGIRDLSLGGLGPCQGPYLQMPNPGRMPQVDLRYLRRFGSSGTQAVHD